MNNKEWLEFHKSMCQKMQDITVVKNRDYCGDSHNPFRNFENVERLGITSTEHGFLVRITDKLARLSSFVNTGELHVKDEKVEDTILDAANYLLLMAGYIESKKHPKKEVKQTGEL